MLAQLAVMMPTLQAMASQFAEAQQQMGAEGRTPPGVDLNRTPVEMQEGHTPRKQTGAATATSPVMEERGPGGRTGLKEQSRSGMVSSAR